MKLLRDPLGRPIKRLYFKTEELDERCEQIVADFMRRHSGGFESGFRSACRRCVRISDRHDRRARAPGEPDR